MKFYQIAAWLMGTVMLTGCGADKSKTASEPSSSQSVEVPTFCADSAYSHIERQCAFGPRVPGTDAHVQCGKWIGDQFAAYGMTVMRQEATLIRYDGVKMPSCNIIAQSNPQASTRLVIASHWDSRPWADNDPDPANHHTPVPAANDGASGVAVMLELAKNLSQHPIEIGVDFVCFDAEDAGIPQWDDQAALDESSWCLGSQYWATHPHTSAIVKSILLDMVGGRAAHFYQEGYSMSYASSLVEEVWQAARRAGFGSFFPNQQGGYITDDHLPVNQKAHIPMIDIVPYYPEAEESSFGPTWHTLDDTPQHIDKTTLQAVGQTLLQFIYNQKP